MSSDGVNWADRLDAWLTPFLAALPRQAQRRWAPVYVRGLLLPGERPRSRLRGCALRDGSLCDSVEPMAGRVCPGAVEQLHHFVAASPWATSASERVLAERADALVGGPDAVLIVDDTALVKQGRHSVGVQRQYCGQLGKRANCQALVSLTLARGEVPVPVALRLFLPDTWVKDAERRKRAGVPEGVQGRPKWQIALDEIDRVLAAGARFGCVLGDAEYGKVAAFRHALDERGLRWAVGIPPNQKLFPPDVTTSLPERKKRGRPPERLVPSAPSTPARDLFADPPDAAFRTLSWRMGTKGPLAASFSARRMKVADGPEVAGGQPLPGEEVWLVCEHRATGERKHHLTNHPPETTLEELAAAIKARWACERVHQQLEDELGLDHHEGRGWLGLHHHALLCLIAPAFLQAMRLGGKIAPTPAEVRLQAPRGSDPRPAPAGPGPPPAPTPPAVRRHIAAAPLEHLGRCPNCGHGLPWHMLV